MATSATDNAQRVASPCVRKCTLDQDNVCVGCYRNIEEICSWGAADNARRRDILQQAAVRRDGKTRRA